MSKENQNLSVENNTPVQRKIVTGMFRLSTLFNEQINCVVKKEALTLQQFNVLRILRGRKGEPANLQDITRSMLHPNSNVSRIIDKLLDKELVERSRCKIDGRKIELIITESGQRLLARLDKQVDDCEEDLVNQLTPQERDTLLTLMLKLTKEES